MPKQVRHDDDEETRHRRSAKNATNNAVSWHGQRFAGTRHGRYAQNDVCSRHEQHGNRLGRSSWLFFIHTSHKLSALHMKSNAVSWHGQHGNRLGRSSWLSLAIKRATFCHAELVSASHIEKTLKQVQGDDKGVFRVTIRVYLW